MRYNLYDIYLNNKLIMAGAKADKVHEITGIPGYNIASYAKKGAKRKSKNGVYTLKITEQVRYVKPIAEPKPINPKPLDPEFEKEWDQARFRINPKARVAG